MWISGLKSNFVNNDEARYLSDEPCFFYERFLKVDDSQIPWFITKAGFPFASLRGELYEGSFPSNGKGHVNRQTAHVGRCTNSIHRFPAISYGPGVFWGGDLYLLLFRILYATLKEGSFRWPNGNQPGEGGGNPMNQCKNNDYPFRKEHGNGHQFNVRTSP